MQYLPGLTVQCINPLCEARGHWLRADVTSPFVNDGRCPYRAPAAAPAPPLKNVTGNSHELSKLGANR